MFRDERATKLLLVAAFLGFNTCGTETG